MVTPSVPQWLSMVWRYGTSTFRAIVLLARWSCGVGSCRPPLHLVVLSYVLPGRFLDLFDCVFVYYGFIALRSSFVGFPMGV
jgi:hypothetical protein